MAPSAACLEWPGGCTAATAVVRVAWRTVPWKLWTAAGGFWSHERARTGPDVDRIPVRPRGRRGGAAHPGLGLGGRGPQLGGHHCGVRDLWNAGETNAHGPLLRACRHLQSGARVAGAIWQHRVAAGTGVRRLVPGASLARGPGFPATCAAGHSGRVRQRTQEYCFDLEIHAPLAPWKTLCDQGVTVIR